MAILLFTYKLKNLVVSGAVLNNAVVCKLMFVCRVWWGQMGKDYDNITCYIYYQEYIYLT